MNILLISIVVLAVIDTLLYTFNKLSSNFRKKNNQNLLAKEDIKTKLLTRVSELNNQLKQFEENHISKKNYDELVHKYNILLNQYRALSNRNKFLNSRVKKLKEKLY